MNKKEYNYLINHVHLSERDIKLLIDNRRRIYGKIESKQITHSDLFFQIKNELILLKMCKLELQVNLKNDVVDLEAIDTKILKKLCNRIIDLYDNALKLFTINEDVLSKFIDVLSYYVSYMNAKQLEVLKEAVLKTGANLQLWIKLLKFYGNFELLDELYNVFQEGVNVLKNDSMPLWRLIINYMKFKFPERLKQLYQEGINAPYEKIAWQMRLQYLLWSSGQEDLQSVRILFKELNKLKPPCPNLYKLMIAIELDNNDNVNVNIIRDIYVDSIEILGEINISFWISYIRFEYMLGSKINAKRLYTSSLCCLKPDLRDTMTDEYNKMENNIKNVISDEVIEIDFT